MDRLFTMDTKAINYVLMNSDNFPKPEIVRYSLSRLLGDGSFIECFQNEVQLILGVIKGYLSWKVRSSSLLYGCFPINFNGQ
jgi:hypothetical protein